MGVPISGVEASVGVGNAIDGLGDTGGLETDRSDDGGVEGCKGGEEGCGLVGGVTGVIGVPGAGGSTEGEYASDGL